jgi:hypothetical protein
MSDEEETWNHMGAVNILAEDAEYHRFDGEHKMIVYGDDIDITLDMHVHEWVNHAGVQITEDKVILHVSLFDPRGAFTLEVYRKDDGSIVMSVPHENGSANHARLTPIGLTSQGVFLVGESAEADKLRARQLAFQQATTTDYDAYHKEMGE